MAPCGHQPEFSAITGNNLLQNNCVAVQHTGMCQATILHVKNCYTNTLLCSICPKLCSELHRYTRQIIPCIKCISVGVEVAPLRLGCGIMPRYGLESQGQPTWSSSKYTTVAETPSWLWIRCYHCWYIRDMSTDLLDSIRIATVTCECHHHPPPQSWLLLRSLGLTASLCQDLLLGRWWS